MDRLFRSFALSLVFTVLALGFVFVARNAAAGATVIVLAVIELVFSFDNAVINAHILNMLSIFWQKLFLSVGILIAIFGVRALLPLLIVALSAHVSLGEVATLALHRPTQYAHELELAHPVIAAFGSAFLLMLSLHFLTTEHEVRWLKRIETPLGRSEYWWLPLVVVGVLTVPVTLGGGGEQRWAMLAAGVCGVVGYSLLNSIVALMGKAFTGKGIRRTGLAALVTFIYLEVIDASLSFDGVIGAFAITSDIVLIAVGLGIGAVWIRSLTVYMVRHKTLQAYRYLEHGAHYAILVLALAMLLSIIVAVPGFLAGIVCLGIMAAAVLTSRSRGRYA